MKKARLLLVAFLILAGAAMLLLYGRNAWVRDARPAPLSPPTTAQPRPKPPPKPLPPASLRADVDGDGVVDSRDDELKGQWPGVCMRLNDDAANGAYDDAEHGDDDLQEFSLEFGAGYGGEGQLRAEAKFEPGRIRFFRSRIATPENEIHWPLDLSKDAPAPKKVFLRVDGPLPKETTFILRLIFGNAEKIWSAEDTTVTVAARIGDPGYFAAARNYIVQNRTRLFLDQAVFHRGEDGMEEGFAWAIMRSEATRLQVVDTYNRPGKKLIDIGQVVAAFPGKTVVVNGGSVWDADGKTDPPSGDAASLARDPERHMTKMSNGGIISGGVKGKGQPYRHRDGRIIDSAGYIGWSQAGGFEFGVGAVVPSDRGYTEGLGGLLPGASYDRTRCGMVGQVTGGDHKLVLVANTDLDHRINGREDNGSGKGATAFRAAAEASAGAGNLTLYFRDSAASVAFAHRGPDDVLRVRHAGFRHTVHQPSIIHNYLAFECDIPAIQGREPAK